MLANFRNADAGDSISDPVFRVFVVFHVFRKHLEHVEH